MLLRRLALVAVPILALLGGWALSLERAFIYFPLRELEGTPADWGLAYEEAHFSAADGVRLHGWYVPAPAGHDSGVTWLWFHGNAGNSSHRLENLRLLHDRLGVAVFIFDYRGYGHSEGSPSEEGTYLDAEAALAYLLSRPFPQGRARRIVYFGRSLGAAVAVELAKKRPPQGLILEGTFGSVPELARRIYGGLPIFGLVRTKYDILAKIGRLHLPLLVLHAERDEVIPLQEGRRVYEAASQPKRFFLIEGATHNDTYFAGGEAYWQALREFVQEVAKE